MNRPAPAEISPERAWERACELLLVKLGAAAYDTGIKSLRLSSAADGAIHLVASDAASAAWMRTHHPGVLEDAFREAGLPWRVDVTAPAVAQGELFPDDSNAPRRRPMRFGSLVPRYTVSTFVIGASNQFAHAACKAVATQPGKHYNPLFLYGGVGLGKTHLANAIGHDTLHRQPDARVAYLSAETFMTQLITALRRDRMQEFKGTFRKIDVLILDDVQFLANRERTQEEFFHTFNALHEARKQIVLTSDKVPKDIPGLEERLRNRFEWGLIADIQPPDMETRVAILEKKAELEGLDLPRDVAIHLASKIDSNVRELEGSLTRLSAVASVSKQPITVEFARTVLHDLLKDRKPITIDAIQSAVCETFHVHLTDLVSPRRSKDIALARHVAMYLTRRLTNLSYPNIGERFGHRDHTTVIHGERTIIRKTAEDQRLRATVEQIERYLQSRT